MLNLAGPGVIYLPRTVAGAAGRDGWLCVAAAAVVAMACVYVISSLTARFPGMGFREYAGVLVSRPVAVLFSAMFLVKIIITCALDLRVFGELVREALLPLTPFWVISALVVCLGAYAACKGLEVVGRLAEALFFVFFLPLAVLMILCAVGIDFTNLKPVFAAGFTDIAKGAYSAGYAFSGVELLLLGLPFINKAGGGRRGIMSAAGISGGLLVLITIMTIAGLSPETAAARAWPLLDMLGGTRIPGAFMERQDAVVMSLWIISAFLAVGTGLFFSSLLMRDIFNKGKQSQYVPGAAFLVAALSIAPDNYAATLEYIGVLNRYASPFFLLGVPFVMLILARVRGIKRAEE